MRTNIINSLKILAIITMIALLAGCSGSSSNTQADAGVSAPQGSGSIAVALAWPQQQTAVKATAKSVAAAPAGVATIRITVSATGMTSLQQSFAAAAGTGTISGVTAGTGRTVTTEALDATGSITHKGSANNITVVAGQTADAGTITMNTVGASIVDTRQSKTFNATTVISAPSAGQAFYGQDAQFSGVQSSYTKSSDGLTVKDNVTGLTWKKSPDTNGDGVIDTSDKLTLAQAQTHITTLNAANYGGYSDWRLPTIKELYSLITFAGIDPSGYTGTDTSVLTTFINRTYFDFAYGSTANGGRIIDMNYASSTPYVYHTMASSPAQFGVNFADGRIKGYSLDMSWSGPGVSSFPVQLVRGAAYGANDFVDNGDSTITDRATGLMWSKGDSAKGLNWQEALAWAQTKNAENYLGHSDWRLPNAKELQNIVDYTRSPDTTYSAAIDPLFTCTGITNEAGKADFPFYWTGTTHMSVSGSDASAFSGGYAVYVAFGRAMGYMTGGDPRVAGWLDVHGAGAQRSDPKVGNPADYPQGHGPQGDAIRIYNYVRLVRNAQ